MHGEREFPELDDENFLTARAGYQDIKACFSTDPSLRSNGVLGFSGGGVVSKYQQLNRYGEHQRYVALKMAHDKGKPSEDPLGRELQRHHTLRGAEHIAQTVPWAQLGVGGRMMIAMEFLVNGSLKGLIEEMNERAEMDLFDPHITREIPNRVLWRIFLCLTRACVVMVYPPADFQTMPEFTNMSIRETIKDKAERRITGDFGITTEFTDEARYNKVATRQSEEIGKELALSSSTLGGLGVSGALDAAVPNIQRPLEQLDGPDSVDVFGSHTNIWQIGMVMFNLVVRAHPRPTKEGARWVTLESNGQKLETHAHFIIRANKIAARKHVRCFDQALRELIARCTAEAIANRPGLKELLALVGAGIVAADSNAQLSGDRESDEEIGRWPDDEYKPFWDDDTNWEEEHSSPMTSVSSAVSSPTSGTGSSNSMFGGYESSIDEMVFA
ncbi:Uu.00g012400.m01.CDS01 [Anthostomella pinea]|uniref:Uu.00g012400.m01.CDS01 n=1 Tax=Anthostomella pinea TaxID=933095 RepID=A0AAI8VS65_9PEZI|nr:Uu.00g012400.m01.CDS01 [Anthostomella pinea]